MWQWKKVKREKEKPLLNGEVIWKRWNEVDEITIKLIRSLRSHLDKFLLCISCSATVGFGYGLLRFHALVCTPPAFYCVMIFMPAYAAFWLPRFGSSRFVKLGFSTLALPFYCHGL
ncbi:unnamed protein product [Lathyrus oleraceus]|uniref:uncharacterized protein LOC127117140 isoform X2 n=1 Tax=Pisum sativum TaxID=3888 RepID=UPI001FC4F2DA|nr:uncharacterized protein LOC127117140 isoform X2 [Pisum sativum]